MIRHLNAGQKIQFIPGIGIHIIAPRGGAVPWWLAGGINPANCVAAFRAKGADSYAASKVNLANPGTYNAYEGAAPAWNAAQGWIFDGTQYLRCGILPYDGWSMFQSYSDLASTADWKGFTYSAGRASFGIGTPAAATVKWQYGNGGSKIGLSTRPVEGVVGIAGQNGYLNGILDASDIPTDPDTKHVIVIGGITNWDTAYGGIPGTIAALAFYNVVLTTEQITALTNAMMLL